MRWHLQNKGRMVTTSNIFSGMLATSWSVIWHGRMNTMWQAHEDSVTIYQDAIHQIVI